MTILGPVCLKRIGKLLENRAVGGEKSTKKGDGICERLLENRMLNH